MLSSLHVKNLALIQEAGVDGIFYSVQNAEVTRFTVE